MDLWQLLDCFLFLFLIVIFIRWCHSPLQELPAPILDDIAVHKVAEQPKLSSEAPDSLDSMKIAWRYQNLPKVQVVPRPALKRGTKLWLDKGWKYRAVCGWLFDPFLIKPARVSSHNGMWKKWPCSLVSVLWQLSPPLNPWASQLLWGVNEASAFPFSVGPDYSHLAGDR